MDRQATPESRTMIPVEGHPGVWRRGNRYVVKYTDRGQVRKKFLRTLTEAKKFKAAAAAGDVRPASSQTFKNYATEWLRTYRGRGAKGITDETRESYAHAITQHAIPFFRTTQLGRIDPPALKRYIEHLEQKGLTAATIRRYYAPVRALLATAYEDRLISHQPNVRVVVRNAQPAKSASTSPRARRRGCSPRSRLSMPTWCCCSRGPPRGSARRSTRSTAAWGRTRTADPCSGSRSRRPRRGCSRSR